MDTGILATPRVPGVAGQSGAADGPALDFLTQESPPERIERLAGSKARSLHRLPRCGVSVPRWVVLGSDCFAAFRAETGLDREIARLLAGFSPERAAITARSIVDAMLARPVGAALREIVA